MYGQDVRLAYMDVPPQGTPNGHTVVCCTATTSPASISGQSSMPCAARLPCDRAGPDWLRRSSKPIIAYQFTDMARNTRAVLQSLKIDKAMIVGHSMGAMLAARFATQFRT